MNSINRNDASDELPVVYAATYDHLGIILWGRKELERILDQEIARLKKFPDFKVGWDHEAFVYDYLAGNSPEVLNKLKETLRKFKGRLGIGSCTYGQPLSAFINEESNIRHLTMALKTTEKHFNYHQSIYLTSEHAFHTQLPQLLTGCGFRGVILRTHFMMYGHNPEFDAPVGWWKGMDGSRIPAVPTYVGQTEPPLLRHKIPGATSTLDNRILTDAISDRCKLTLEDFRRKFGNRIRPLVATRADDPRSEESLIACHAGDNAYKWVTLEDIFELLPRPRVEFDIQTNDFKPRMPWGYCGSRMLINARKCEAIVLAAERLAAIGHSLGFSDFETKIEAAWKNLLIAQHHDIQICGLEDDFTRYSDKCLKESGEVIESVMKALAPRIGYTGRNCDRYVIFNPLPWERTELVSGSEGSFVVTLPALGFKAVEAGNKEEAQTNNVFLWQDDGTEGLVMDSVKRLVTPFYEVYPGEHGGFRLIRDRWDGQDAQSRGRFTSVSLEKDRATMVEEGHIHNIPYRSEWVFYSFSRRIDWHGELDFNREQVGRLGESEPQATVTAFNDHEHKLRLRFYPYILPHANGIRDLPFCISETQDPYIEGVYWTAVSDGNVGVALLNRGLMGSVHEKDGAFSSVLAFSLPYVWGTRMLEGKYSYDLGILPFKGHWRQADLHRQALEYNFPCIVYRESRLDEPLGEVWTPYEDTGSGRAILSALYTRNGKTYARFYESEGSSTKVSFRWMGKPARFTQVDLRERELCDVGGSVTLGPWQVETLALGLDKLY